MVFLLQFSDVSKGGAEAGRGGPPPRPLYPLTILQTQRPAELHLPHVGETDHIKISKGQPQVGIRAVENHSRWLGERGPGRAVCGSMLELRTGQEGKVFQTQGNACEVTPMGTWGHSRSADGDREGHVAGQAGGLARPGSPS